MLSVYAVFGWWSASLCLLLRVACYIVFSVNSSAVWRACVLWPIVLCLRRCHAWYSGSVILVPTRDAADSSSLRRTAQSVRNVSRTPLSAANLDGRGPVGSEQTGTCSAVKHTFVNTLAWGISVSSSARTPQPSDVHCCHMVAAIKHPVPDQVKPSFVIFDIRALWCSALDIKNYKWYLNPVWHRMLSSCTHMATVDVKVLSCRQ